MALTLYTGGVQDCTPPNALSTVLSTGTYPANPKVGDTSYLWVNFDLEKPVFGGNVTYSVVWNYIPIEPEVVPLCEQIACPMYPGTYNVSGNTTIPEISGLVEVTTQWVDSENTPIWCVKSTYNL